MTKFAIGLDFGTESGRALIVDVTTGREVGSAVYRYADGVIDEHLPGTSIKLEPDTALQNPNDYVETLKRAVPEALKQGGIRADDVIGIGVDFTACTILPTRADGTPLCTLDETVEASRGAARSGSHQRARERNEAWLAVYGGIVSSEWLLCKTLQLLNDAPEIFAAADRIVEAGDWIVWQLSGVERRNACAAGYKGLWVKGLGYPNNDFLCALDPRLDQFNETKINAPIVPPGTPIGKLTEQAAKWMGLRPGIAVAAATIDAHAAVPGAGVTEPGRMILDRAKHLVPGISGVVEDGILPGLFGYEAGQVGVGDIFEWFVEHNLAALYKHRAKERGISPYQLLEEEAARLKPGESGLLALDWWNGCRTPLVDADLSGVLIGATLGTRSPDIYRALIEATAYGTAVIIETFETNGVQVDELVACGGLAERNKLLLQIYADVTGRPFKEAGSGFVSAVGAAMFGAVAAGKAAGGYDSIADATQKMARFKEVVHQPDNRRHATYQQLLAEYRRLLEYFGRGENVVMKRLREIRRAI